MQTIHFLLRLTCAGVLQVEAMAQLAGICMIDPAAEKKDQFFFGGIENCRWRKPVVPGDTLVRAALLTTAACHDKTIGDAAGRRHTLLGCALNDS